MYYELVSGNVEQYSLGALEVFIIIVSRARTHTPKKTRRARKIRDRHGRDGKGTDFRGEEGRAGIGFTVFRQNLDTGPQ